MDFLALAAVTMSAVTGLPSSMGEVSSKGVSAMLSHKKRILVLLAFWPSRATVTLVHLTSLDLQVSKDVVNLQHTSDKFPFLAAAGLGCLPVTGSSQTSSWSPHHASQPMLPYSSSLSLPDPPDSAQMAHLPCVCSLTDGYFLPYFPNYATKLTIARLRQETADSPS